MGIIRKQSVLSSIFIYIGFGVGAINVLVLFPNQKYFTIEEFGLTKILIDVSLLMGTLCTLGTSPAIVKFYPFYNSYLDRKKNDLPVITLLSVTVGCILFVWLMPFFKGEIIRKYGENAPLFVKYFNLIYPLTISMAFLYLFEAYSWAVKRTVLSALVRELIVRVSITVLIILVMFNLLNFYQFIHLYSMIYVLPVMILLYSLLKSEDISFHFKISSITKRLKKRIVIFSLFIFSGQVLNVLARTLDSIIISSQSAGGLKDTGIFTIATYFIALMEVPMRGMTGIAFSVLAQAWKEKDLKKVFSVYRKTALNLLIIGLGIIGILLLNMKDIIKFLGPDYKPMVTVVLILGISKLIDLGTGLNSHLLLTSKQWKIEFITNVFLVFMAGVLNYFLVKKYGIIGSSWATLLAFTTYNSIRFLLIWKLFKMQPFTKENLFAIFVAAGCYLVLTLTPEIKNIYVNILFRTVAYILSYSYLVYKLKLSDDLNDFLNELLRRVRLK